MKGIVATLLMALLTVSCGEPKDPEIPDDILPEVLSLFVDQGPDSTALAKLTVYTSDPQGPSNLKDGAVTLMVTAPASDGTETRAVTFSIRQVGAGAAKDWVYFVFSVARKPQLVNVRVQDADGHIITRVCTPPRVEDNTPIWNCVP